MGALNKATPEQDPTVKAINDALKVFLKDLERFCNTYPDSSKYIKYFLRFLENIANLTELTLEGFLQKKFVRDWQLFATNQIITAASNPQNTEYKESLRYLLASAFKLKNIINSNIPSNYSDVEEINNFKISTTENWLGLFITNIQNICNSRPVSSTLVESLSESWTDLVRSIVPKTTQKPIHVAVST